MLSQIDRFGCNVDKKILPYSQHSNTSNPTLLSTSHQNTIHHKSYNVTSVFDQRNQRPTFSHQKNQNRPHGHCTAITVSQHIVPNMFEICFTFQKWEIPSPGKTQLTSTKNPHSQHPCCWYICLESFIWILITVVHKCEHLWLHLWVVDIVTKLVYRCLHICEVYTPWNVRELNFPHFDVHHHEVYH
jgi:hypothetical protein